MVPVANDRYSVSEEIFNSVTQCVGLTLHEIFTEKIVESLSRAAIDPRRVAAIGQFPILNVFTVRLRRLPDHSPGMRIFPAIVKHSTPNRFDCPFSRFLDFRLQAA